MGKAVEKEARYGEAVRRALASGPKSEAVLARIVVQVVGVEPLVRLRRHYAKWSWRKAGKNPKTWTSSIAPQQEALLAGRAYVRRVLRPLVARGQATRRVDGQGERVYALVRVKGKAKAKEGRQ